MNKVKCCRNCKYEYYSPMTNFYLQENNQTLCIIDGYDNDKVVFYDGLCDKYE